MKQPFSKDFGYVVIVFGALILSALTLVYKLIKKVVLRLNLKT